MNYCKNKISLEKRKPNLKISNHLILLFFLIFNCLSFGQTNIFTYSNSTASIPTGFVLTNNVATNPIDQTSYLLVDAGATSDYIVTPNYDLSTYTTATINVKVATFGTGTSYPLKIEFSTNGGTSWNATSYTTATPSSSTYITGGPIAISQTFTATTKFRFSNNGTSGRGVRIQNLTLDASTTAITSVQSGNWSNPTTWSGGVVPIATNNVVIASGHTVTMDNTLYATRNLAATTTVNSGGILASNVLYTTLGTTTINGAFQLNAGGAATGTGTFVYGSSSTLIFNNTSSYGVGALDIFWPNTNGPNNINVLQGGLTLNLGANKTVPGLFQTAAGVTQNATLTLTGTCQINNGGYFNNPPTYGPASTLIYNSSNSISNEWTGNGSAGVGIPTNVTIQSGILTMTTTDRGISGNLTIGNGATLTLNSTSGDLNIGGNFSNSGTFNANGRSVTFGGTTTQTLTGVTTFDYLKLNNSTGLTLNNNIIVTTNLDLTLGKLTLGTNNLTLNSSASISNASATNYIVTNSTGRLVKSSVAAVAFTFPIGLNTTNYTPVAITNTTGTSNLSVNVGNTITNTASDATKIVTLQWSVTSSAATTATITPTWVAANQAVSFTNTGTGELGNYTTAYNTYPVTLNTTTTTATGVALQNGSNLIVVGNTNAIFAPPPANDLCSNATTLTIGAAAVSGTLSSSTTTSGNTFTYGSANKDVWYKFTPNCSGSHVITLTFTTGPDIDVDLFSTSCPTTGTAIATAHGSTTTETITSTLTGGTVYYIRVIDWSGTSNSFNINVTTAVTPTFTLANTGTPTAGNIVAGTSNAVLFGFGLTPNACTNSFNFTATSITLGGTATATEYSNFRIIVDANANGIADAAEIAAPIGTVATYSATLGFTVTGQTGLTAITRYLLIADASALAPVGRTLSATLTAANTTANVTVTGTATGNTMTLIGTPPALTAASGATVDNPFVITFTDNPTWRATITSVTVGGTTLTAGYTVSAGQITFTPSASTPSALLQTAGTKTIAVNATNYGPTSVSQAIGYGVATKLGITTQPTAPANNGGTLATQPVLAIQDQYGNTVATATNTINATVGAGAYTLGGSLTLNGVAGVATYTNLTASSATLVSGASITFTATGLTSVTSNTFTVPAPDFRTLTAYGVTNTEDFTTIGTSGTATLPQGMVTSLGTTFSAGSNATTLAYGNTGTGIVTGSSSGGVINWAEGVTGASTERALGFLTTGSFAGPRSLMAKYRNTTGGTINSINLVFDYEKYRSGSRAFDWTFFTSTDGVTWTAVTNGNLSYPADGSNTVVSAPALSTTKTFTLSGLTLTNNTDIYLRWNYLGSGGDTNAQGLAVDNIQVTGCRTLTASIQSNNSPICAGNTASFTVTGTSGATLNYNINGGTTQNVVLTGGTASINLNAVTANQTLNLVSVTEGSCSTTLTGSSTVTVNPNIPASVSIGATATTICTGASVTFTATPTNGGSSPTYQWTINGANIPGETGVTFTSSTLINGNQVAVVMTSNASPCLTGSPATSNVVTMAVNPIVTPTFTAIAPICAGASLSALPTTSNNGIVGTWSPALDNTTTTTYTFTPNTGQCATTTTLTITLNTIGAISAINGITSINGENSTTYSVSPVTNASCYVWSLPAGMSIASSSGNEIITNISNSFTGGIITVKASNSCGDTAISSLNINNSSTSTLTISGPKNVCSLTSATYFVNPITGANYIWTLPNGMTLNSGANTNSINVTMDASFNIGAMSVIVTTSTNTYNYALTIGRLDLPEPITGPTNLCGLTATTYSVPAVPGATSYSWTVPTGVSIIGASNSNTINVNITGNVSGSIVVQASGSCGLSPFRSLKIETNQKPSDIAGPTQICGATISTICNGGLNITSSSNNEATYSIDAISGANSYTWTSPVGTTIVSGQGSNSIKISYNLTTFTSGQISVATTTNCGSSGTKTLDVGTTKASISGPTALCDLTTTTYSVPSTVGTSFMWTLPSCMTLASGQSLTNNSITVNITGPICGTQTLSVAITGSCGPTNNSSLALSCTKNTKIQNSQNGAVVASNIPVYADAITGALGYRFRITNTDGFVSTIDKTSRYFTFSEIAGISYGKTYSIEVAIQTATSSYTDNGYGCSIPVTLNGTKIQTSQCGITIANNLPVYADTVVGAIGYKFEISDASTGTVISTLIKTNRYFYFNEITTLSFGATYNVRVAIKNPNGTYSPYGQSCGLTLQSTKVQSTICGTTVASNTAIYADSVVGATGYKFEISNALGTVIATLNKTSNFFYFNEIPSISFGANYQVRVAPKNTDNSTYGLFGASCQITLPKSQVQTAICGTIVASNTPIYADSVIGATGYKFEISNALGTVIATLNKTSNFFYFNEIPGISFGANYQVRVAVKNIDNTTYSGFGNSCQLTLQTSQIQASQCGATVFNTTNIYADIVADATGYKFEISNTSGTVIATLLKSTRYFNFTEITNATINTTYLIRVAPKNPDNSSYGSYGSSCSVTCQIQNTKIQASQCGTTIANNLPVYADLVNNASGYSFEITNSNGTVIATLDKNIRYFYFNEIQNVSYGETYTIRVAPKNPDGITYGLYGTPCTLTLQTTKIQSNICGTSIANNLPVYADNVIGATGYRFEISNSNGVVITTIDRANRYFYFNEISGLSFGTSYSIRVAPKNVNGTSFGLFGSSCQVTLQGTKIQDSQCGSSVGINLPIYADNVVGAAGYRFEISNNIGTVIATLDKTNRYFYFNEISGITFGTDYYIRVALKNSNGNSYGSFGTTCTVSTLKTKIQSSQCGTTLPVNLPVYADVIVGASGYQFEISNNSGTVITTLNKTNRYFYLNEIPGYTVGATYSVRVAVKNSDNTTYSPYGTSCNVTIGNTTSKIESEEVVKDFEFIANTYPNPFDNNFKLRVKTNNDTDYIHIKIYDMLGKQIEEYSISPTEIELYELGNRMSSGVYNIIVSQGEQIKTLRIIKR